MFAIARIVISVLFSVVLVFNIAGNSLVIYIITNERGMKTSTNYLLLNLAVADLLFGVFLAPYYIVLSFFHYSLPEGVVGDWLCKLLVFGNVSWIAARASIFTMVCLSVERYFAVCRPHTFSQRFSPKIVKVLIAVSWIYASVMVVPLFVYTQFKNQIPFPCDLSRTPFLTGHTIFLMSESVSFLILMAFFLVKICISLWCKQTVEPTGEREITERKKKKKVTLCVLAVLVTFMVCWIPVYVNYIFMGISPKSYFSKTTLLATVNAALDPFLFSFQSSRFKVLFKKIVCCKKE